MAGCAIRQSPMSMTSCERWRAQARHAVVADRELHPGTPAEPRRCGAWLAYVAFVAGHGLHRDLAVDTRQPPQLLGDDRGLERALGGQRGMLPVTAAAAARVGRSGTAPPPGPATA